MKLRTVRTFDEIDAFYTIIRDQLPRLPHILACPPSIMGCLT